MNPLEMTVRQWQALLRINADAPPENTTAFIALRPKDVVVTDGKRLFACPLPEDRDRDFSLFAEDVRPWINGLPRKVEIEDDDEDDGIGEVPTMLRLLLSKDGYGPFLRGPTFTIMSEHIAGTLVVIARTAGFRVPDSAFDSVLELAAPGKAHLLQSRYLRDLDRLYRAFGTPQHGCRIMSCGQDGAAAFTFGTEHGQATYIVMRMTEIGE